MRNTPSAFPALVGCDRRRNWRERWRDRFEKRVVGELYYERVRSNNGIYVAEADWDTLIVLDAARFDVLRDALGAIDAGRSGGSETLASTLAGARLQRRVSRGSATPQFLRENFAGTYHPEIVYVTANPMVNTTVPEAFHEVVSVWRSAWDESERTVLPGSVREAALRTAAEYPHKRQIVHFMQPHWPFLGYDRERDRVDFTTAIADPELSHPRDESDASIWELVRAGVVDPKRVWAAYRENHRRVLPDALRLAERLEGRTVITSDHGNVLGDRPWPFGGRVYGHPPKVRLPDLVTVPWLVFEGDQRREIHADGSQSNDAQESTAPAGTATTDVVAERLEALGYG